MQDSLGLWVLLGVLGAVVLTAGLVVWVKGRRIPGKHVFRASRLSPGNLLFPTQVKIHDTGVVHHQPQWLGRLEHSIHIAHVASIRIDTNLLFSDVYIETTGGASPIHCRGHRKHDAETMKALVERYQSAYYQAKAGA